MEKLKDVMKFPFEERDMIRKENVKVAVENFNGVVGTNAYVDGDGMIEFYDQDVVKIEQLFELEYVNIPFAHNKDVPFFSGRPETFEVVKARTTLGYYHKNSLYKEDRGIIRLYISGFILLYLSACESKYEVVDEYSFVFNGMQYTLLKALKELQSTVNLKQDLISIP